MRMELKDFVSFKVHVPSLYYVTVAEDPHNPGVSNHEI